VDLFIFMQKEGVCDLINNIYKMIRAISLRGSREISDEEGGS